MAGTGKITLELDYEYDKGNEEVRLTHPSLTGEVFFKASSLPLALAQISALNLAKQRSTLEHVVIGGQELFESINELRSTIGEFRKAGGLKGL